MLDTTLRPMTSVKITTVKPKPKTKFDVIKASEYTMAELTAIYNETRTDYLVPMPMSEKKLTEYVYNYDVNLEQSVVVASKKAAFGLGMLGVRGDHTWITRLGITASGRGKGVGRAMMNTLIDNSKKMGAAKVILEVIANNTPARTLFESLGFATLRDLLVIRRPPIPLEPVIKQDICTGALGHTEAVELLKKRADNPSWVTANESMLNSGGLNALVATNGQGWVAYQNTLFSLSRIILETQPNADPDLAIGLLQEVHLRNPLQDTAVENLPVDAKQWVAFVALGYMTSFTRVEMELDLKPWLLKQTEQLFTTIKNSS